MMVLDEPKGSDVVKEVEGLKFLVDEKIDSQYDDVTVDYQKTLFSKGYVVRLDGRTAGCS